MQVEEVILSNNRANPSLKYDSYHFLLKNKGKMSASFVCSTSRCYASISLSVNRDNNEIQVPYRFKNLIRIGLKTEYLENIELQQ